MTNQPPYDVALVVPCFDVAGHLPPFLASVAALEGFERTQVILVDDGSSDGTRELLEAFTHRHPQALLVTQPGAGPGAARNRGLREVRAGHVAFADADDVLREFTMSRRDAALQCAARSGELGDWLARPRPLLPEDGRPAEGEWRELPLNPAVAAHGEPPRYRLNGGRVELTGSVTTADGRGFGSRWTSSTTPVGGVLDPAVSPPRTHRGVALLQTLPESTLNVATLRISEGGVLTLSLPRVEALPGWIDLSAMTWPLS